MLNFEPFSIDAFQRALKYVNKSTSLCSDLSLGFMSMWRESGGIYFCIWNDTLTVQQNIGSQPAFSWPVGADVDGMIDELLAYVRAKHMPMRFFAVDDATLELIRKDKRLQPATWAYDERWSDYIYSFEDAMTFKGKKFSGQRNHINRFRRLYGEPVIRRLTREDRPGVDALLAEYKSKHSPRNKLEETEFENTVRLLDSYEDFGFPAACLTVDGEIAAISIGEIVGEMLLIHVEKALTRYEGIYPTMYSGFVRFVAEWWGRPLRFVNREDDSGDPGLRTSKRQYHPILMAHKNIVHIDSPAARHNKQTVISGGKVVLTELRENDKEAYLEINTDIENNRFWGYDYREDMSITGQIDENTFFDSVQYDMKTGDSINFAVREADDGEMIGECILWNFTSDGTAELGCRLKPEYHGRGYGKAAFRAAADFAMQTLKLRVWARCHHQNKASFGMITGSGFREIRKDDTFFYFERIDE